MTVMTSLIQSFFLLALAAIAMPAHADSASLLIQAQTANPTRYQFAIDKNAEIRNTSDNKAFTVWWQPSGVVTPAGVIVTLHGHDSFATDEFYLWQSAAEKRGYAILALQWWFGGGEATSDYYTPREMIALLTPLLADKGVAPGSALLHGYSRGAANSYALTALDISLGKRYFGMTLSNSGGAAADYPPNQEISAGIFGNQPFGGVKWLLYCGEKDPDPSINGCPAMTAAKEWVGKYGAEVVLFIDDPLGDHGGFMLNSANVNAALLSYADFLAAKYVPTCSLAAAPNTAGGLTSGTRVTLGATCGASATGYAWSKTGFAASAASGTVTPFYTTTYAVIGSNAKGAGGSATFTVQVNDSAVLAAPRRNYTIVKTDTGYSVKDIVGNGGTRTFTALKRLRFGDGALALDIGGVAGQAYRLYQASFDRAPDLAGLGYQMAAIEVSGLTLQQVAQNFIDSPEFAAKYGALDDNQFVTQLYANVLRRTPDTVGLQFYLNGLASKAFSRAMILAGFSESPENQTLVLPAIQDGIAYTPLVDSAGNGN